MVKLKILLVLCLFLQQNCDKAGKPDSNMPGVEAGKEVAAPIITGAERVGEYLPLLKQSKGVALIVNQTSRIGDAHLVDTLLSLGVPIRRIFAPEHGFRGQADAGEQVKGGVDVSTGLPIASLYGSNKKPKAEYLQDIDWVVFDIQDVGARFYTYISTMSYAMEACAEQGVNFMVLDRPNPNGHFVDGPLLEPDYASFVGLHPVPVVHGMTVGEYARMANGEGWLENGVRVELKVIRCEYYDHSKAYELPIPPSPNLPNMRSIYLYPSLCFFEGTLVSVGRGTNKQFQVYGYPKSEVGDFRFTPQPMPGAKYPKQEGKQCRGYDLSTIPPDTVRKKAQLDLDYLVNFYQSFPRKEAFFLENNFFDKLAGSAILRKQIKAGMSAAEIRQSWQEGLQAFKAKRKQYLLYKDFE